MVESISDIIPSDEKHGYGLGADLEDRTNAEYCNSDQETMSSTEGIADRSGK